MNSRTRQNRRNGFSGSLFSNTKAGVQIQTDSVVRDQARTIQIAKFDHQNRQLEERVMPVVNISVKNMTIVEGDSGTKQALFTLERTGDSDSDKSVAFQVDYSTADGTGANAAQAGIDYVGVSSTVVFQQGEATQTVAIDIIGNNIYQNDREFFLNLSNPVPLKGPDIKFGDVKYYQDKAAPIYDIMMFGDVNGDGEKDFTLKLLDIVNISPTNTNKKITDLQTLEINFFNDASNASAMTLQLGTSFSDFIVEDVIDYSDQDSDDKCDDIIIATPTGILIRSGNKSNDKIGAASDILPDVNIPIPGGVTHVKLADIDNDGTNEIIVSGSRGVFLLKKTSSISFSSITQIYAGQFFNNTFASSIKDFAVSDINGDRYIDIVPLQTDNNGNAVIDGTYINNNRGGFYFEKSSAYNFTDGFDRFLSLESSDLNNDGFDDIIVNITKDNILNNPGTPTLQELQNGLQILAGSSFGTLIDMGQTNSLSYCRGEFALTDCNNDGLVDIVVSSPTGVLINKGNFQFSDRSQFQDTRATTGTGQEFDYRVELNTVNRILVDDWNEDGITDIISNESHFGSYDNQNNYHVGLYKEGASVISIYLGSDKYQLTTSNTVGETTTAFNVPQFVRSETEGRGTWTIPIDINGDGIKDLFSSNANLQAQTFGQLYPAFSRADQAVLPSINTTSQNVTYYSSLLCDMNNDGSLDFISRVDRLLPAGTENSVSIYYYDKNNGKFGPQQNFDTKGSGSSLIVADFGGPSYEGSSILDYAYTIDNVNGLYIALHELNNITGSITSNFSDPTFISLKAGAPRQILYYDLDGNNQQDIIYIGTLGVQVIFNGNADNISPLQNILFTSQASLADFDKDGLQDLVGINGSRLIRYPLSSNGTSGGEVFMAIASGNSTETGDFNNDGLNDIVVFGPLRIYENTLNQGFIQRVLPRYGPNGFHDYFIADLNYDGKIDIAYSTNSVNDYMYLFNDTDDSPVFTTSNGIGVIQDNDAAASIRIVGGNSQTVNLNTYFPSPLSVEVLNADGTPVEGINVKYQTIPGQFGTDGFMTNGSNYITGSNGIVNLAGLRANDVPGSFQVQATALDGPAQPTVVFDEFVKIVLNYSYADAYILEGDNGVSYLSVKVKRTGAIAYASSVDYATQANTALDSIDFNSVSGTLVFGSGESEKTVQIPIIGNNLLQNNRTFSLNLSNPYVDPAIPSQSFIPSAPAVCTIIDDDDPKSLVLTQGNNQSTPIGQYFATRLTTTVLNINGNPVSGVSVEYIVRTGSSGASGTFDWNQILTTGSSGQAIASGLKSNLNLGNFDVIVKATGLLGSVQATFDLTVLPLVNYTASDAKIVEGDTGTRNLVFLISRSGSTTLSSSVDFTTLDNTAVAGIDFQAVSGSLNFAANEITKKIQVPIISNTRYEANRTFQVFLKNPKDNAGYPTVFQLSPASLTGTIIDDDAPQYIKVVSGNLQSSLLNHEFASPLQVRVQNANGYSVSGVPLHFTIQPNLGGFDASFADSNIVTTDALGNAQSPAIMAGSTPGEFLVNVGIVNNPYGNAIFRLTQRGTINYAVADASVIEGNGTTSTMTFNVKRTGDTWLESSVEFQTVDGTAIAGIDYIASVGKLTFGPGETEKSIKITVLSNSTAQADRSFELNLKYPANDYPQLIDLTLPARNAVGLIQDDDSQVAASRFGISSVFSQPAITGMVVQNGVQNRSFVRYVNLTFNQAELPKNIAQSLKTSTPDIRIENTGLNGKLLNVLKPTFTLTANQNSLKIDFGKQGVGSNAGSSANDGVYRIDLDLDGNGSFETSRTFHRLLGDINGNGVVDSTDDRLFAGNSKSKSVFLYDANGDDRLNNQDATYIRKAQKRKILV